MKKGWVLFCTLFLLLIIGMFITLAVQEFELTWLYRLGWFLLYCIGMVSICLLFEGIANLCILIFNLMEEIFEDVLD
jgi:cellulose synthase/poly-beta-1,6-N-acetylglucosamine synthase-like glycosyltransferase